MLTDRSQVGDVKHSDLPGMEALGREGKKDGQVIMIKNNGQVEAYSVSSRVVAFVSDTSGHRQNVHGNKLARSSMPSDRGENSCTKGRSMTMCSTWTCRRACHH